MYRFIVNVEVGKIKRGSPKITWEGTLTTGLKGPARIMMRGWNRMEYRTGYQGPPYKLRGRGQGNND